MFETLFKRIAGRLARAFYDESSTPRRGTSFGKQSDLGTIDWSDASYFKSGDSNRILRKLLTGKFKRDKRERKKRIASENSAKSTAGMDIMQASGDKGAKTKTAITEHSLTNSTLPKGTANMNVLNANNNKYNSKNQAISRGNADRTANSVDKNHVPKDSGRNSWQAETVSPATGFDDVDLEDETNDDDYLPTFEYLLNYDPDLN